MPTLPHSLEAKILKMRAAGLPEETGGVLFGVVDLVASRIDIIEAWPAGRGRTDDVSDEPSTTRDGHSGHPSPISSRSTICI
jgi:hypothetical protein